MGSNAHFSMLAGQWSTHFKGKTDMGISSSNHESE